MPLGVVTEMAFYRDELAVRVAEVDAGSPAERTGLQPGILIVKANDKPVLHPMGLVEAGTGRSRNVNLSLGRGGF